MKIIHVPFSTKVKEVLLSVFFTIPLLSFFLAMLAVLKLDIVIFFCAAVICYFSGLFSLKILRMEILLWTTNFVKIRIIDEINNLGFIVRYNSKSTLYKWRDIKNVRLLKGDEILVRKKRGKDLILNREYSRWFDFLKRIPKNLLMDDEIPNFVDALSKRLKTCPICGKISLDGNTCLYCNDDMFNKILAKEYANEIEYIRTKQFDLFCTDDKMEKVNFKLKENDGFDLDENWKPLISVEELIEFSKENHW
jgi:hypothetical protein